MIRRGIPRIGHGAASFELVNMNPETVISLAQEAVAKGPQQLVTFALQTFSNRVVISFSGAEDVVLIDMAAKTGLKFRVFTLDTGRLHPETYRFLERAREYYNLDLEILVPESGRLERLVREKGLFSFYQDGHQECCTIRKVEPLRRMLSSAEAWITGLRGDQNPETRGSLPAIQIDPVFSAADRPIIKFNPLAAFSSRQVWSYILENNVPYNSLHENGYLSIGCEPCTRPVLPGQHEREGRWWWERAGKKECGLHLGGATKVSSND